MKAYIFIFVLLMSFLYSCNEEELAMNSNKVSYLYFGKDVTKDSTIVSFFFYIDDQIEIPVELKISGKVPLEDIEYKLVVDPSSTLAEKCYKLPEKMIWKANHTVDSVYITLINDEALKTANYTLILNVVDNGNFVPGEKIFSQAKLSVTDQPARPGWWEENSRLEYNYLGPFTVKKFEAFIIATNGADLTDAVKDNENTDWDKVRRCALMLKRYIEQWNIDHPDDQLMDEDGKPMIVPVVG